MGDLLRRVAEAILCRHSSADFEALSLRVRLLEKEQMLLQYQARERLHAATGMKRDLPRSRGSS